MSDSIGNNRPKTVVKVSGDEDRVQNYNKGNSLNSEHDYSDNLKEIKIWFGESSLIVNRASLDQNIHSVRTIFSECINDNVDKISVTVLDKDHLKQNRNDFENPNSIHVNFDSGNQVLVYSWPNYHQFDENKWNNFLLQLEEKHDLGFIGTGVLQFKYKGFNYRVYPPFVSLDHGKAFDYYKPEVFSFSPTEISQIIEDIKESHQSIEKKIIDHYQLLKKDFVKNGEGYIHIKAGIDENNVKNFTNVFYTNRSDDIHNNPIEEAFVKEEEHYKAGGMLHNAVYMNNESILKKLLEIPSYDVNAVNKNDRTPLHLAAKYGREGMVEMLLNEEAKVDVVDNRGRTPLHLAAQYNEKKEIVEMLLNKGAKVDIADSRGRTPLHLAAVNGHKDVVEALLKANGINVNAVDEDGKTPFDLATDDKIKTLLQPTEKSDPVDESFKDSEGVQEEDAEPAQTEEQPSSFFGSLFSILMKPFSLIASFFGGFFSWLFGSDEPTQSSSESDPLVESDSPPSSSDDLFLFE
ncbi:ankyrin repeat domain-containing protein [Wolbachia endosymbiont of Oedothorax gibbosus]|uniref:ankyrin repeat domain-containing protein n=1 Tax=Wolbachia endosymbiont of Oedothorax gibbosus TaxID=931100 RepID=UPI002023E95B|nr:ankyrin repeat domain-containing protein [Wolbachia endosymbiont of Oedothorax gibbosus]